MGEAWYLVSPYTVGSRLTAMAAVLETELEEPHFMYCERSDLGYALDTSWVSSIIRRNPVCRSRPPLDALPAV